VDANAVDHAKPLPGLSARLRTNPRLAQQNLGGKTVVLHYEGKRLLGLNAGGTFVWSLLDGRRSLAEIAREVADRDGIDRETAEAGVLEFVQDLHRRDLVIVEQGFDPQRSDRASAPDVPEER